MNFRRKLLWGIPVGVFVWLGLMIAAFHYVGGNFNDVIYYSLRLMIALTLITVVGVIVGLFRLGSSAWWYINWGRRRGAK